MRLIILLVLLTTVLTTTNNSALSVDSPDWQELISTTRMLELVDTLASDEYEGRFPNTLGDNLTQQFLNQAFEKLNATKLTGRDDFLQPFSLNPWVLNIAPTFLKIGDNNLSLDSEFVVLSYSGGCNETTDLVFAGYGVEDEIYTDYHGIEVAGKVVVVVRGVPNGVDSAKGYFAVKAATAKKHGAVALLAVNHPTTVTDILRKPTVGVDHYVEGFASLLVSRNSLESLGIPISTTIQEIDSLHESQGSYNSELNGPLNISVQLLVTNDYQPTAQSANVVGMFPGIDTGTSNDHAFIISGHHDHLGVSAGGEIYNGADDDASGVAVTLEVAQIIAELSNNYNFRHTVIFSLWGAEEVGLVGSTYYTNNPLFPLDKTRFVIQNDMVGTGSTDGFLRVAGGEYVGEWTSVVKEAAKAYGNITDFSTADGSSDHVPFLMSNVPAVMFFWDSVDQHPDYHTTNDTVDKLNPEIMVKTVATILGILLENQDLLIASNHSSTSAPPLLVSTVVLVTIWLTRRRN